MLYTLSSVKVNQSRGEKKSPSLLVALLLFLEVHLYIDRMEMVFLENYKSVEHFSFFVFNGFLCINQTNMLG